MEYIMSSTANIRCENDRMFVVGDIDFHTVTELYKLSLTHINAHATCVIDFVEVHVANSAALALMLEWLKFAKSTQHSIQFANVPRNLLAIAKAADLEMILNP
jgi:phospholipid transport system transporter-binding protein